MTSLADHSTDYGVVEREPPEVMARNLWIASRLWSGATVFFFAAFLFAYFYLRALDNASVFRPPHVNPSQTLGALTALTLVAAAVLLRLGFADHRAERRGAWRIKGAIALALLAASVLLQLGAWSTQAFGAASGPYASVYTGWTGLMTVFVIGLAYWVETTLATSIRFRNQGHAAVVPEGDASGDPHRTEPDIDTPVALIRYQIEAVSSFALVLAAIGVVTWAVLYLL